MTHRLCARRRRPKPPRRKASKSREPNITPVRRPIQSCSTPSETFSRRGLTRVKAQAARYSDTTALLQALGGGWWNRVDETPAAQPKPTDIISAMPLAAGIRAQAEEAAHDR